MSDTVLKQSVYLIPLPVTKIGRRIPTHEMEKNYYMYDELIHLKYCTEDEENLANGYHWDDVGLGVCFDVDYRLDATTQQGLNMSEHGSLDVHTNLYTLPKGFKTAEQL